MDSPSIASRPDATVATTQPRVTPTPARGAFKQVLAQSIVRGAEGACLESSLQQSQETNLYHLQIQEAVNAQNRSFTALSNVLKAEHDTVKTARNLR